MRLVLNSKFYKKEAVKQAIKDFKNACDAKILNNKIEVELKPKENVKNLEHEFSNYVLGLMKNNGIV